MAEPDPRPEKTMLAAIHQLHYLPWLRYFEKIARSDVFVVLDNIQFNKNGWQNRNTVKTAAGATLLTVPVHVSYACTLDVVAIDNRSNWARKHWETIRQSYARAPHFQVHAPFLESAYARRWERLNELNRFILEYFVSVLGIKTRLVYASELNVPGEGTGRLINLLHAVGADRYYTGAYALDQYLDAEMLRDAGISIVVQEWSAPRYPQLHGDFVPDLAVVDLLLNCGMTSLDVLLNTAMIHDGDAES